MQKPFNRKLKLGPGLFRKIKYSEGVILAKSGLSILTKDGQRIKTKQS